MRKIEKQMNAAIAARKNWKSGNTAVTPFDRLCHVYLHGHHIASVSHDTGKAYANPLTLKDWPTATTKSRLRALGVHVTTKDHITYLEGVAI